MWLIYSGIDENIEYIVINLNRFMWKVSIKSKEK